ncbi:MAG TPA: DUF4160 domain-containing protein [Gemmatimonadaceae bacterium]|nr:DUF4160 domain-containing protein [Gemmatimonadaceae bacterium]
MPTVIRSGGFSIRILLPPREHAPPHVHVVKGGAEVVIRLGERDRAPKLLKNHGMKTSDIVKAFRLIEESKAELLAIWDAIHGE